MMWCILFHIISESHASYPWDYWPHEDGRSKCGYVGLTNLGATCYMATCMQHLYMIPQARQSVLQAKVRASKYPRQYNKPRQRPVYTLGIATSQGEGQKTQLLVVGAILSHSGHLMALLIDQIICVLVNHKHYPSKFW